MRENTSDQNVLEEAKRKLDLLEDAFAKKSSRIKLVTRTGVKAGRPPIRPSYGGGERL